MESLDDHPFDDLLHILYQTFIQAGHACIVKATDPLFENMAEFFRITTPVTHLACQIFLKENWLEIPNLTTLVAFSGLLVQTNKSHHVYRLVLPQPILAPRTIFQPHVHEDVLKNVLTPFTNITHLTVNLGWDAPTPDQRILDLIAESLPALRFLEFHRPNAELLPSFQAMEEPQEHHMRQMLSLRRDGIQYPYDVVVMVREDAEVTLTMNAALSLRWMANQGIQVVEAMSTIEGGRLRRIARGLTNQELRVIIEEDRIQRWLNNMARQEGDEEAAEDRIESRRGGVSG